MRQNPNLSHDDINVNTYIVSSYNLFYEFANQYSHPSIPPISELGSGRFDGRGVKAKTCGRFRTIGSQSRNFPLKEVNVLEHGERREFPQPKQHQSGRIRIRESKFLADCSQLPKIQHCARGISTTDNARHARSTSNPQLKSQTIGCQRPFSAQFDQQCSEWAQVCGTRAHKSQHRGQLSELCFFINGRNYAP